MLLEDRGLTHAGKAYNSDLYLGRRRLDWPRIVSEVRFLYKEPLFLINEEGEITAEATPMKWAIRASGWPESSAAGETQG